VVEGVGARVAEQHPQRFVGAALEGDAELLADGARAAVRADQIGGADGLGCVLACQRRGDAVVVLGEADQCRAEFDVHAEFGEPIPQDALGPGLAEHPEIRVGDRRSRVDRLAHPALGDELSVQVDTHRRCRHPCRVDGIQDAQVVEDLQGPWLDAVATGSGEEHGGPVDDPHRDVPAGEVEGEGQAGGSGACDENEHEVSLMNIDSVN